MAKRININSSDLKPYEYKKRSHEPVEIVCRILIVCEGSKTEPNYFNAFHKKKRGLMVFDLEFAGGGINTIQVVDEAIRMKNKASAEKKPYDRVWAVFDKDSFSVTDFNAAIIKAGDNHIGCAWSNEAFELWYLLHFHHRVTPMSRKEYKKAISDAVNDSPLYTDKHKYEYRKNDPENYQIMNKYGNQAHAIKYARAMEENFTCHCYARHNPCTKVYAIVLQLMGMDEKLNREIKAKVNKKHD